MTMSAYILFYPGASVPREEVTGRAEAAAVETTFGIMCKKIKLFPTQLGIGALMLNLPYTSLQSPCWV